jgi:hypothetical protein
MAETCDLILKGGIVVNQDGIGARDIGVRAGRIAAIGDIGCANACVYGLRASRDRTRCGAMRRRPCCARSG